MKTIEDLKIAIVTKEIEIERERNREHDLGKLWEASRNNINTKETELRKLRAALEVMDTLV